MEKTADKLVLILVVVLVTIFSATGFFFGKYVEKKKYRQYGYSEAKIDTVYITKTKIRAQIKTVFLPSKSNQDSIPQSDLSSELPVLPNPEIKSYEIASIDTTFQFSKDSWHKLKISYNELENEFFLDSTFRVYEAISVPLVSMVTKPPKTRLTPFLVGSWQFGNENQSNFSVLGIGVGIKYKKIGIGVVASSNKTAGGMVSFDF